MTSLTKAKRAFCIEFFFLNTKHYYGHNYMSLMLRHSQNLLMCLFVKIPDQKAGLQAEFC